MSSRRLRTTRTDPAHSGQSSRLATRSEVQAVQLVRSGRVQTSRGPVHAVAGQWLVTESDGRVRVVSDDIFRYETLRQQLTQLVIKSRAKR